MASPPQILSESTQYLYIQVTSDVLGVPFDPTIYPVAVDIVPPNMAPSSWTGVAWVSGARVPTVQVLIGPLNGGIALQPGNYDVYVKITATPEVPVILGGRIQVIAAAP